MMTLWIGLKQLHSTSDKTIGPNEEEEYGYSIGQLLLSCAELNFLSINNRSISIKHCISVRFFYNDLQRFIHFVFTCCT